MTNKESIYENITEYQVKELAKYILDIDGPDLSLNELTESVYLVMENISEIDSLSIHKGQLINSLIRNQYYENIKCKR